MSEGLGIYKSIRFAVLRRIPLVLFAIFLPSQGGLAETAASGNPQGVYLGRDGDLQLSVTLRDDGCYRVRWLVNDEEKGTSRGRWKLNDDTVKLTCYQRGGSSGIPQFEHMNSLKGFRVLERDGRRVLVADWNFVLLNQAGVTPNVGCFRTGDAPTPKQIPATNVPVVSIKEVVANKRSYRGRRVAVIGDYRSGFEWSIIQQAGTSERDSSLWVGYGPVEWAKEEDFQWVKQGRVKVVGTITFIESSPGAEGNYGHMGMCPAGIIDVEYFKQIETSSRITNTPSSAGSGNK